MRFVAGAIVSRSAARGDSDSETRDGARHVAPNEAQSALLGVQRKEELPPASCKIQVLF